MCKGPEIRGSTGTLWTEERPEVMLCPFHCILFFQVVQSPIQVPREKKTDSTSWKTVARSEKREQKKMLEMWILKGMKTPEHTGQNLSDFYWPELKVRNMSCVAIQFTHTCNQNHSFTKQYLSLLSLVRSDIFYFTFVYVCRNYLNWFATYWRFMTWSLKKIDVKSCRLSLRHLSLC